MWGKMKPFYERNTHILDNPKVNLFFEDILSMNEKEFRDWVILLRKTVVDSHVNHGCNAKTGKEEVEIIDNWNKLETYPVHEFGFEDELDDTTEEDVIINRSRIGGEVDQFFPNMMRTRINYSDNDSGYSIFDLFNEDKFLEKMVRTSKRHYRRDSFYNYSLSGKRNNTEVSIVNVDNGKEWLLAYFGMPSVFRDYDFFLEETVEKEGKNSGYNQVAYSDILYAPHDYIRELLDLNVLEYKHYCNIDIENLSSDKKYIIRIYKKGQRLFPKAFASFRIGYIQPAVNFPPMTAKYLYERFTEKFIGEEPIRIYDPSAGWGGRILGAMSVKSDRSIHYIGTDPNPENFFEDGSSRYSNVVDFYHTKTTRSNQFFTNQHTYEVYQLGSEVISEDEKFQTHKGKIHLTFTSPPYFNREAYSEDENQSYKKYGSSYESWRDGFLEPTIRTICEWTVDGGVALWNIADILVSGGYFPLEQDSIRFFEKYGMRYMYTIKMTMQGMPGQNRVDDDGVPKCKNYCKVNGKYYKYEPIFLFEKS